MPNRTLLIAGNWKMNNDVAEAAKLADELAQALPEVPAGVEVLVCPPTIDITTVHDRIQAAPIALGAQNVYWEAKGAFTGESSCDMLKSAGCTYCIIGHSERRDYFHETDEDQNKKAKALVAAGLVPVFCCGESLEVREAGTYVDLELIADPDDSRDLFGMLMRAAPGAASLAGAAGRASGVRRRRLMAHSAST